MKTTLTLLALIVVYSSCNPVQQNEPQEMQQNQSNYLQNRTPLTANPYIVLPIGSIKPSGWLRMQLENMRDGMTGHLDELYSSVVGERNGWLGGDGDGWERGPYWIDGLLPLAYILNDQELKDKVQPWIEWTINNQTEDGYLGPVPFDQEPEEEPGLQRGMRRDWWPKMVMLKILQQYYNATGDERVITTLTKYFKYQLKELPNVPLDNWTFWADRRGGDNLMIVYWLYNITGDSFLLDLGELITEQTFPWTTVFLNDNKEDKTNSPWYYFKMKTYPFDQKEINALSVAQWGGIHCVNFAQGFKQPVVYYQQNPDQKHPEAVRKALHDIQKYHGQPQGMYGGDEGLHGKNPVQGVEFCSIAEWMFSLETIVQITGDMEFADHLEKIVYNALPTQATDDFSSRQYFQAANQVQITDKIKSTYMTIGHGGTDFCYGLLTGYPCCTANMHQAWPKYVQNLWYATADGGVAALQYAPCEAEIKVADGKVVRFIEKTGYPFRDEVTFQIESAANVVFPFHLRIPSWTESATVSINGEKWEGTAENGVLKINRTWSDGDKVTLKMPMQLRTSQWYDFATSIERGPLVYALRVEDEWKEKDRGDNYGSFYEVFPTSDWNYALYFKDFEQMEGVFQVTETEWNGDYPWNLENAPIMIKARGIQLPEWQLSPDGLPLIPGWWGPRSTPEDEIDFKEITLVPYGCTTLRITEFPVYGFF